VSSLEINALDKKTTTKDIKVSNVKGVKGVKGSSSQKNVLYTLDT